MKQKLLNKFWLRVGMIVAVMTTALAGTAWAETVVDVLNQQWTGVTGTTYSNWTNKTATSSAVYAGNCAGGNNSIQLRSNNSSSGIVTTTSGGKVKKVTVEWNAATATDRVLDIYGKNTAYTNATDLYNNSNQGTKLGSITFDGKQGTGEVTVSNDYEYIGLRSSSGAMYLKSITITWETSGSSAVATTTTIDASGITNTDVYTGTTAGSLSATVTANGTAVSGATVTWSGDNNNVATINASTGAVTLVGAGTVTFTASYAGVSGEYKSSSATYEMTVTDSTPFIGSIFIFNTDAGLTELGITKPESGAGTDLDTNEDYSIGNVTMNITHGGTNTRVWNSNGTTDLRVYNGGSLTFTVPAGNAITKVTFAGSTIGLNNQTNGVWTASGDPVNTITFTNGSTGSKINTITVEYEANTTPMISAENVNIDYSATSGNISYSITNPVAGTSLTASTDATWLAIGTITSEAVPFTCSANEVTEDRTATIALTYGSVTKEVTVTQAAAPVIYTTIPALFEAATSTETEVNINFGGWVVSGVSGKNAYLTDNQGHGLIIYEENHGFAVNDVLTGTVSCTLVTFNGSAELKNLKSTTTGLSVAHNGTVAEASIEMANLAGVNTGVLVSYENLTCSVTTSGSNTNYDLTDGTTTIRVYKTLYDFTSTPDLEDGKTYNIKGIFQQYGSIKEILPRSAADIEEVEAEPTTITAGTLSHVTISGVWDGAMEDITLGDNVVAGTTVYFTLAADDGYVIDEVTVLKADNNEVTLTENAGNWSFTMPNSNVTINASAIVDTTPAKTLTNANIVAAGAAESSYKSWTITDNNGKIWNAYAIKNQHSNATSAYHYLQIKKYASGTAYYLQVPEYGTKITSISMTVSNSQNPMDGGSNAATLYFSASNSTSAAGEGVASGTGASTVTIDCSSLNLNTGYITASGAVRIWDVTVVYEYTPETITLNASGYATFASTSAVDFDNTTGCTAWAVTAVSGTEITFSQITGTVAAGTGVLLKGEPNATVTFSYATSAGSAVSGNLLEGVVAPKAIELGQYYGLKGNTFVKVNTGTVPAGKALLPAGEIGVKTLTFNFDDDATAIETLSNSPLKGENIYNLAGQRLSKMQKGINIVNGRKVLY